MRQRVLWGLLAVVIAATVATGHLVLGMVATGAELVLFDLLAVAGGLGVFAKPA
jgi:hypothetical protein